MIDKILAIFMGSKQSRDLKELFPLIRRINQLEPYYMGLNDEGFKAKTLEFKERYVKGESLDQLLPEAFACAREAARRILGERAFDVQLMGAITLHKGKIMEMKTGEGKTLSSVPAAYLNAIPGKGLHVITVNDYLAKRDAEWMRPVYDYLGLTVGAIHSELDVDARQESYAKDITYGTNNEFGFDYLRDNLKWDSKGKTQRGHYYCIIDEIDSILIDEARTPLIISGPAEDDTYQYATVNKLVSFLEECKKDPLTGMYPEEGIEGDYKLEEKNKRVSFTDQGMNKIEELLLKRNIIKDSLFSSENFEYIHYFTQSLRAHKLFHKEVDYIIKDNKVQIVDEFTGRVLYGRRYSDGLHQAIEAKERIKILQRNRTLATITFQNYFRMYDKISGMTGTADTEAKEFGKIYGLDVVVIPTNRPLLRDDRDDLIFLNEAEKLEAICEDISKRNQAGQPILVGTVSIEKSEELSAMLLRKGVRHEVLNAKNHAREAMIVAEAGAKGSVTIATNMAGRGTDIKLGGNPEFSARKRAGTQADEESYQKIYKEEFLKWQDCYQEIKDLGGLYIIGTERHESRRIDNQLRGRSGRQGDPGASRFYISTDDTLMRLFGDNLKGMLQTVGMKPGEPIMHPLINRSIEKAQKKVEERNFEIRKHLLDFDDVLNEQRKFIYEQRDEILDDENLSERVLDTAEDILDSILQEYNDSSSDLIAAYTALSDSLKSTFLYELRLSIDEVKKQPLTQLKDYLLEQLKSDLHSKEEHLGKKNLNLFIRYEYLRQIDLKWQDHLEHLDALKEAVYLRSYSQKNPLLEYKLEGFQIFDSMLEQIRQAIALKLFKVKIQRVDNANLILEQTGNANHTVLGQFGATPAQAKAQGERREASPQAVQVKRTVPKVGRNDPCPCGSGKKYKHCHGS
ncbi:MAG: preprotein translocase subunit SecA [Spirochaetales bacterium]|nr:preprotein translocase subunit SecA [Spirochaetales bacterium]